MTTVPGIRSAVEAHLAEQLSAFAREFVADLEAQGRLVEAGGAGALERLRTQVEAGQNCPEAYHAAVDTIVEDCGYPSEVAMRIATALNRKGLIPGDDVEPRHDREPAAGPEREERETVAEGPGATATRHDRAAAPEPAPGTPGPADEEVERGHDQAPASVPDRAGPPSGAEDPDPRHDRASVSSPLVPAARGAIVLHLADRGAGRVMADYGAAPVPRRVEGQVPRVRPAAARSRAVGWGSATARAVSVAASLQSDHLARLEAMQITADGERVTVAIKATCLADWEYWLDAIGAPRNVRTRTAGHAQVAAGTLDGVAVHLTAHGVPELLQEASDAAVDPFFLWGRIYDLGLGQVDRADRIWLSLGRRQDERGMPLLVLRGTDGPPYPLASIVMAHGPLTATPLPSGGLAGDSA
ncbi:BN159_2729 family protein [Streptomyces aureus]|uniref:BN159_2729 family protein n=1 Tax=Streptomyces aureus TaxID=193461 RepID=UPI0005650A0C|nr:BN159_2729 family protein [Streptomyces aureus]